MRGCDTPERGGARPGEEVRGGEGHPTPSRARQHPISSQLKIDFCAKLSQTDSGASLPACACVEDKLGGDVNQRHRNNVQAMDHSEAGETKRREERLNGWCVQSTVTDSNGCTGRGGATDRQTIAYVYNMHGGDRKGKTQGRP